MLPIKLGFFTFGLSYSAVRIKIDLGFAIFGLPKLKEPFHPSVLYFN